MQTKAENFLNPFRHIIYLKAPKKDCDGYILFIMKQIIMLQEQQIKLTFLANGYQKLKINSRSILKNKEND